MIKLKDIIQELDKPANIYAPGQSAVKDTNDDMMKRGFKLGTPTVNPETGASTTTVTYLPAFEQSRRDILTMRKEFQPFKFSTNPDIAHLAKEITSNMAKLSQLIFALDKTIELHKKG